MKHPQTIGVVERSHSALKRILKLKTDEKWTTWYKYVDLATFIHNTSYHSSIGCTPSSLFHGREPIKPIDLRFKSHTLAQKELASDYLIDLQDSLLEKFSHTKSRLLDPYHKYRTYYDKKAAAKPLVPKQYCLLLNPSLLTQSDFAAKSCTIWLSLYKIEKVWTKSNYLIRKIGTPYTQCVHRIRLRPITPNYDVEDISVTQQDFKPDPSLDKYRSEHEIFDDALEASLNEDIIEMPEVPKTEHNRTDEVQHTIRGVITPATTEQPAPAGTAEPVAIIEEADTVPPFPPPPVPGSDDTARSADEIFPEPNYLNDPIQVHATSSQLSPTTERTYPTKTDEGAALSTEDPTRHQRMTRQSHIPIAPHSSLTKTPPRQRLRFDSYDHFRDIPTRRALAEGGYYEFLNQQEIELPLSKQEKRTILVNTAQKTRSISQSGIPVPNINKTPEKFILKKRYPERSTRGQPPPSNDISSASFQPNMCDTSIESVDLPEIVRILHGDLFREQTSSFGHCVSSDLAMSAGIATQFVRLYPELEKLRTNYQNLKARSLIAHFSSQNGNWIYNLEAKNKHYDKPTYYNLRKSLCRMKSHMLTYGIKEINLPQIGCGLDKLEWARVFNINLCLFANTDIRVNIFLQKVHVNSNLDNTLLAEEYPNDEKTRTDIFHMANARKLAFEGKLKTPNH